MNEKFHGVNLSELRPINSNTLGADLRALRKARGLTLIDLAEVLNRSVGWLSQVERDLSVPTISDLQELAAVLDVSVSSLAHTGSVPVEEGLNVRADARRPIRPRIPGLVETLLSPDLTDDYEVLHSVFAPGAQIAENVIRETTEIIYVIKGRLDVWINDTPFRLGLGDSFRLRGDPYRWANPYDDPCETVWIISPPVY